MGAMKLRIAGIGVGLALALAACVPIAPKTNFQGDDAPSTSPISLLKAGGYRFEALGPNGQSADTLVIVAMSGGGKRSASFSYGVLKGLRDTRVPVGGRDRTLLSQVSIITSVSGGSFTSAYYGLHREKIFETYERDFLKRDIEAYIYGTFLLPWNWRWMVSSAWGTNDRMAEVYDRLMFHGATYADLQKKGQPLIVLNATEISYGVPFSFIQTYFDMICSDLDRFKLARAVAASNGFPVIFTPITLTSYIEKCPNMRKALLAGAPDKKYDRSALLRQMRARLVDPAKTRYLHLMDGGIVDNLALRGLLNVMMTFKSGAEQARNAPIERLLRVRRILVLVADGQAINDGRRARRRTVSSLGQIFDAVSGAQIDQYNVETLLLAQREFEEVAQQLRKRRCEHSSRIAGHACSDVKTFFLRVSLADVDDPKTRARLQNIKTGLTIPAPDVDALVEAGRNAVLSSDTIKQFVDSLK